MSDETIYYRVKGVILWHAHYSNAVRYRSKSNINIEWKTISEMTAEDIYNIANSNL